MKRREFLRRAAMGLGAGACLPGAAHAFSRTPSPNDRINLGFIGLGAMGQTHLNQLIEHPEVQVIAGADPDAEMRESALGKVAGRPVQVAMYARYQEMLAAHPDIDAVFVSTPDHWHALACSDAMRAGMDVYCETPLALTIPQGRAVVSDARRLGRVVQMGASLRSDVPHVRHACELVRAGLIGDVRRVVSFQQENPREDFAAAAPPPKGLDWDYWLGPAPAREFNPKIHPTNWRYFRDYSGGMLADSGTQLFDIALCGLNKTEMGPHLVTANVAYHAENLFEFPRFAHIIFQYEDGINIEWHQATEESSRGGIEAGESYGVKFYGSGGEVFVNREGYKARALDSSPLDETLLQASSPSQGLISHHQDFLDAMRSRKRPACDVEVGHRATTIAHLGNIAALLRRPIGFDPEAERFTDDVTANRIMDRPMRAPWRL